MCFPQNNASFVLQYAFWIFRDVMKSQSHLMSHYVRVSETIEGEMSLHFINVTFASTIHVPVGHTYTHTQNSTHVLQYMWIIWTSKKAELKYKDYVAFIPNYKTQWQSLVMFLFLTTTHSSRLQRDETCQMNGILRGSCGILRIFPIILPLTWGLR